MSAVLQLFEEKEVCFDHVKEPYRAVSKPSVYLLNYEHVLFVSAIVIFTMKLT